MRPSELSVEPALGCGLAISYGAQNSARLFGFCAAHLRHKSRSRDMHDPGRLQDGSATERIAAPLDPPAAHQIHRLPQDALQFILHVDVIEEFHFASGANVTSRSTSLSCRKSSRRTEPKRAISAVFHRLQKSVTWSSGISILRPSVMPTIATNYALRLDDLALVDSWRDHRERVCAARVTRNRIDRPGRTQVHRSLRP